MEISQKNSSVTKKRARVKPIASVENTEIAQPKIEKNLQKRQSLRNVKEAALKKFSCPIYLKCFPESNTCEHEFCSTP